MLAGLTGTVADTIKKFRVLRGNQIVKPGCIGCLKEPVPLLEQKVVVYQLVLSLLAHTCIAKQTEKHPESSWIISNHLESSRIIHSWINQSWIRNQERTIKLFGRYLGEKSFQQYKQKTTPEHLMAISCLIN